MRAGEREAKPEGGATQVRSATGGEPGKGPESPSALILASGSPRRRDILQQLGLEPLIRPAHVDESYLVGESPAEHVERLARAKAAAGAAAGEGGSDLLVVGGDTVVVREGRVLVKPDGEHDAVRMLLSLSGGAHDVLSGLAVAAAGEQSGATERGKMVSGVSRTVVRMRSFDEETARRYVETGEPMDKAGGYGIQGQGAALVEGIEGDYYSVVGFPVGLFLELLERLDRRFAFGKIEPQR